MVSAFYFRLAEMALTTFQKLQTALVAESYFIFLFAAR